jgi:hypothetical protein
MDDQLGAVGSEASNNPALYNWDEVIDFSTDIAVSSSALKEPQIDSNYDFAVDAIGCEVWNPAVSGNVPAFTPATFTPSASDAADNNDWISRTAFRMELKSGSLDFWKGALRLSLAAGTVQYPRYLRQPRWIAGGTVISCRLHNDRSLVAVQAHVVLYGRRKRK